MQTIEALGRDLDRSAIEQARRMSMGQKFRAGGDLFDDAWGWMLCGVRAERPTAGVAEAMAEVRRRIDGGPSVPTAASVAAPATAPPSAGQSPVPGGLESTAAALDASAVLSRLATPHLIVGSHAVSYYGTLRLAANVDLLVEADLARCEDVALGFGSDFDVVRRPSDFVVARRRSTGLDVRLLPVDTADEYDRVRFGRAVSARVRGRTVPLPSARGRRRDVAAVGVADRPCKARGRRGLDVGCQSRSA